MTRPRLLFLSQVLPFPPDSGVAIRTYHTLRILSEHFDVSALCFYRRAAQRTRGTLRDSIAALEGLAEIRTFPIPQEHSRVRLARDHAYSVLSRRPYTWYTYDSRPFLEALLENLAGKPAIAHVESLDLIRYLSLLETGRVGLVHHNIESKLLARRARTEGMPVQLYLRHQARLLERAEGEWAPRVALNVVVSSRDESDLRSRAADARTLIVPNGVDIDEFRPGGAGDGSIAFIGGTEWPPNLEALEFFGDAILPEVRRAGVDPVVRWVGRATESEKEHYATRFGIQMTGYVDDVRDHVRDTSCVVVPLRVGGGTRLKITTAWAMGRAVVSTSVGCEGLEAVDGANILIRDDPVEFAEAVVQVLSDPALRTRLGRAARSTVENTYDWDLIMAPLVERYRQIVKGRAPTWK